MATSLACDMYSSIYKWVKRYYKDFTLIIWDNPPNLSGIVLHLYKSTDDKCTKVHSVWLKDTKEETIKKYIKKLAKKCRTTL